MNKGTVSKDAKASEKSIDRMKKDQAKLSDAKEVEMDDEVVEINPSIILNRAPAVPQINATLPTSKSKGKKERITGNSKATLVEEGNGSSDEEDDDDQVQIQRGKGPAAFKQRDLVARAFAGDNVVAVSFYFPCLI